VRRRGVELVPPCASSEAARRDGRQLIVAKTDQSAFFDFENKSQRAHRSGALDEIDARLLFSTSRSVDLIQQEHDGNERVEFRERSVWSFDETSPRFEQNTPAPCARRDCDVQQ
jgi:hypothetical protein